jgi:hypothetical protein
MQQIPLLHIIFYLAAIFLPNSATKFTISSGCDEKTTWVRQADGGWHATSKDGKDDGVWQVHGFVVSVTPQQGKTLDTDVANFIKIKGSAGAKQVLTISSTVSTIEFSGDKDGIFAEPVVVTYSNLGP